MRTNTNQTRGLRFGEQEIDHEITSLVPLGTPFDVLCRWGDGS